MFVIIIKYLKLYLNNKNLLLEKNTIRFELYCQKNKKISILYYFPYYSSQTLIDLRIYAELKKT